MKPPPIKITYSEVRYLISEFIFSKRDRDLISDRLLDGMSIGELASKYNLCERQVKNVIAKNKKIIFGNIHRLPK